MVEWALTRHSNPQMSDSIRKLADSRYASRVL